MAEKENTGTATSLAPGTIDKIRSQLGPLDPEESNLMAQKLGGKVLHEKEPEPIPINPPSHHRRGMASGVTAGGKISSSSGFSSSFSVAQSSGSKSMAGSSSSTNTDTVKRMKTEAELPAVSAKDLKMMDNLMMSYEYEIKPNFGFFNLFFRMSSKNREKVAKSFGEYTVKRHVDHMQAFISTVKTFIQLSPDPYKAKIAVEADLKFRFLRTVGKWTMRDIKVCAIDVEENADNLTVSMLVPFVRSVYHEFITIYYIGEQKVPALIKEIYQDIIAYPDADKAKMQNLAKQGITEWLYIYNQIFKGMYPLLMRMCSQDYVEFPRFFTAKIADILQFLNLTKFDLLLPEKKKEKVVDKKKEAEEAKKKLEANRHIAGEKDSTVDTGIKLLEMLFPMAGFNHLENHPDLYPYFQGLYNFDDGFNMLNPENPVQTIVVLIRIIEDLFHGCRNIEFNLKADEKLGAMSDNISDVMNDWASYHEDLFDKKYGDYLRTYVNSIYSKSDFASTQSGKDNLNNMLWRTKYYYMPQFQFSAPLLQKPNNDSKYRPLYARTDYLKSVLSTIARRIDENQDGKKPVLGVMNPWERYRFDLPNNISRRLDVLLGAKRPDSVTQATNANLIKYTLCIVSVLDWLINNPTSPLHTANPNTIYRISSKDGGPEFSVPLRTDQNTLFAEAIKKTMAKK